MGDIGPAELVRGEIRRHAPAGHRHGLVESIIAARLFAFLRENTLGRAVCGEVGVYIRREPDTVRAADVAFISHERYAQVRSDSYLDVAPELVVEILSPSDRWSDLQEKLGDYFAAGVQIVWLVDPQLAQVHVYEALDQVTLLTREGQLSGGELLPGFKIPLTELFAP